MAIVIVGFMGVGKTTVGELLAAELDVPFYDSDRAFESELTMSPAQYLTAHTEAEFRTQEAAVIRLLLAKAENAVVSLGGGAVTTAQVRHMLSGHHVIWLRMPFQDICKRPGLTQGRPLFNDGLAAQRFGEREPLYAAVATVTIDNAVPDPKYAVKAIMASLSHCEATERSEQPPTSEP